MFVKNYIAKNNDFNKYKEILQSYYDEHKKKFNKFIIRNIWKKKDMIINKISVPCTITLRRIDMFKPDMFQIPIYVEASKREFQDIVDRNCAYNIISDEIEIMFISKFKEMTLQNYMKQPRSILCRKLERNYFEARDHPPDDRDSDNNFLPYCFRHIAFQPSPLLNILLPWI